MRTGTGRATHDALPRRCQAVPSPVRVFLVAQKASGYAATVVYRKGDPSCTFAIEAVINAGTRYFAELRARLLRQGKELDMFA